MRVLLLSLVVVLLAMVLGVAAHHTITTGHFGFGLACLLVTSIGCSSLSAIALSASKKESRLWPKISSSALHFVREVATCLLHQDDVELGGSREGRFVAWQLEPWDANDRLGAELMARDAFLEDEHQYVFRRKEPIQPPQTTTGSSAPDRV